MNIPRYKIQLAEETSKEALEKATNEILDLKDKPYGVYEIVQHFAFKGEAISLKNANVLWLGWQLEQHNIKVRWSQC